MAEEIKNNILQNAGAKGAAYIVPGDGALDARFVVTTEATLTDKNAWSLTLNGEIVSTLPYVGLTTFAKDTQKLYVCTAVGEDDLFEGISWKEVGKETEVPIKAISLNGQDQIPDENGKVELTLSVEDININLEDYYTKVQADEKFVIKEGYIEFTQDEKDKLSNLANITTIGENLSLTDGTLSVVIPPVEVPVKSIVSDDKLLALTETGQLSTTIEFNIDSVAREDGKKYIYVKGKDGVEIGKVDTTDFVVDGMLDSVVFEEIDGAKTNNLIFTFNTASGKEQFTVDFTKYVDVYKADETTITLDSATNTFSVKEGVFLTEHQSLDGYATEVWVGENYVAITEGERLITETEATKLAGIEEGAQANKVEKLIVNLGNVKDAEGNVSNVITELTPSIDTKAITIDLSGFDSRLDNLETLVVGGEGEGLSAILQDVADLKTQKQDKLEDGSSEKPHLIWVSETNEEGVTTGKWTPGKIEIPTTPEERLVPETTNVEHPAILVWDGNNVTWSASEVQKELPEYTLEDEGKILVVSKTTNENNEKIAEVVWATAPNNTTITNTKEEKIVISSVISNGEESVEVYSKEAVNNLLSWEQL